MRMRLMFLVCAMFAVMIGALTISAQETPSQWSGVYTVEQAQRGAALYQVKCAGCHLKSLAGFADDEASPPQPALVGEEFAKTWDNFTLGDLFEKIQITMPRDDPGTLKLQESADILAFMLQVGKAPAGTTELPATTEALKKFKYLAKKPDA